MCEFFRGWRRKIGVLTLLMACLLAAAWVRSLIITDLICIPFGQLTEEVFVSEEGKLTWQRIREEDPASVPTHLLWKCFYSGVGGVDDDDPPVSHCRFLGIEVGEYTSKQMGSAFPSAFCSIPYWLFVIPLTLVSVFLMLSKPRKSTQTKITESIPAEGP
jgi:hypothetical protein